MARINLHAIGTKAAAVLALASVAVDAHDMGKRQSRKDSAKASSDKFVSDSISTSKLNDTSARHNAVKTFIANADFTDNCVTFGGKVGGYLSGIAKSVWDNIFLTAFATVGLVAKSKCVRNLSLIGMGVTFVLDTLINATSLFERTDYLKK